MSITQITFLAEGNAPRARRQTQTYLLLEQVKKEMLNWANLHPGKEMLIPFSCLLQSQDSNPAAVTESVKKANGEAAGLLRALKANLDEKFYTCWKSVHNGAPCVVIVKAPAGSPAPSAPPKRK